MMFRLLNDSTYFPVDFRRWVRDHVENSDIRIGWSQIDGRPKTPAEPLLPAGLILPYAGTTFSAQFLACDGASYPTGDYAPLFAAIGYTWGGSGSTFYVPDMTDRVPQGAGAFDAGNYISDGLNGGPDTLEIAIVTYVISTGVLPES